MTRTVPPIRTAAAEDCTARGDGLSGEGACVGGNPRRRPHQQVDRHEHPG